MKNDKVKLLNGVDAKSVAQVEQIFSSLSKDQVEDIVQRSQRLQAAAVAASAKSPETVVLERFLARATENAEVALQQQLEDMWYPREVPD